MHYLRVEHVDLRPLSIFQLTKKKHDVGETQCMQKTELIHFFHLIDLPTCSIQNSYGGTVKHSCSAVIEEWKVWEKAARDPKMSTYLKQGVKAKMCETTPFVNTADTQYIGARAKIELACDSIRAQGQSLNTCIGIADGKVHPVSESDSSIAESLLTDVPQKWSTMVMRATPFPADLFKEVHPHHQVLLSSKPPWTSPVETRACNVGGKSSTGQCRCDCRVLP